ncbi:hypothetical protein [Serratia sp. JSRIV004]|uniref:hypothetical protein n=1 Tax=Serratia sp. JSRIV004 TaxID=2831895 RepID=UPI001CBAA009|nr:hypothetical protein [Serratia sp. JSRIV004]UAN58332.1 hypothetical protein KGP21_04440 [Serratia sp. JSRIV004]
MKQLQLKDVMQRFTITTHEDGYEVSNPAGTAQYDACGARTTVNGIPEYFPSSISVKDGTKPEAVRTDAELASGGFPDAAKVQAKQFKVYKAEMNISVNVDKDNLDKLEAQLKRIAALSQPLKIKDGQIFIKEAVINGCTTTRSAIEVQIAFQNWQEAHNQHARDAVLEVINKELQSGGVIHQAMKR